MRYTKEQTDLLERLYKENEEVANIADTLGVPVKSVIAKLASMGLYKKQEYRTKRGEIPVKKDEYILRIADSMKVDVELLDSLEKVNKSVLILLDNALKQTNVFE